MSYRSLLTTHAAVLALAAVAAGCTGGGAAGAAAGDAASKVYVAPGHKDEFYLFTSGGFSGNLGVYGLPT